MPRLQPITTAMSTIMVPHIFIPNITSAEHINCGRCLFTPYIQIQHAGKSGAEIEENDYQCSGMQSPDRLNQICSTCIETVNNKPSVFFDSPQAYPLSCSIKKNDTTRNTIPNAPNIWPYNFQLGDVRSASTISNGFCYFCDWFSIYTEFTRIFIDVLLLKRLTVSYRPVSYCQWTLRVWFKTIQSVDLFFCVRNV